MNCAASACRYARRRKRCMSGRALYSTMFAKVTAHA
jgi:hypothetical protein